MVLDPIYIGTLTAQIALCRIVDHSTSLPEFLLVGGKIFPEPIIANA
jgi:hypothetical protein